MLIRYENYLALWTPSSFISFLNDWVNNLQRAWHYHPGSNLAQKGYSE